MDILQRLFYTALSAASIIIFIVKISFSHWKNRGILHEKPKFLTGNLGGIGHKRHISTILQQLYEKYKGQAPFIGCYAYLKPMVLLLDLELIKHVLVTDAHYFMERGLYYNIDDDPLTNNLLQLENEHWEKLHNALKPCFASEKIISLLPTLVQVAGNMRRSLAKSTHNVCPVNKLVDCYNVDAISTLAFGVSGESLLNTDTEFRHMASTYQRNINIFHSYLLLHFPSIARLLRYRSYKKAASDYFIKLVHEKLQEREWNPVRNKNDFLQMFANLRRSDDDTQYLSAKEITAQAFSFILIGLETSNAAMTFCLYELALQPDLQERVRTEVQLVLASDEGDFSMDSLKKMNLLKRVTYETLRKHTPYPFLLRKTIKEYEVPNSVFMLQEDNHLVIPVAAIHHDPRIYPEPNKFDPERFSDEALKYRHPMAFLSFGDGPRGCLARQFAEMQIMVGLATLLRDYSFSPCHETTIPINYNNSRLIMTPQKDLNLLVENIQGH